MSAIYIVSRVYSAKERPNRSQKYAFYGWSTDKNVVKAFLKQRSPKKYVSDKFDDDDPRITRLFPEIKEGFGGESMIDYIKLKFASTREDVKFFTTLNESKEAEIKIQQRFHELCSIDDMDVLNMFMHLDRYYLDALEYIGFRPKEVDYIYDTSDPHDNYNTMELVKDEIDDAYQGYGISPSEGEWRYMNPPGLSVISQVADKLLYSMESFIWALRDDL